ncbi:MULTISPECIES: class I adenylate-forming enzyme family protein [unclassified Brevundimonas]|uniref:class I adenylate-forming enzyme family protein n=1 Tax=unclassified Brevundimonas TaxID=2622653 RepID=UPI0025B884EB|nr:MULTISPECIES: long-chain-fatty-acid--CoA ligase [unclassified Brevundimonas]
MQTPDTTLRDMLLRNALRYADEPAFVCGGRSLSHGEFLASAQRLASALHQAGMERQDRVAVLSMNSLELATVYGACELHGFVAATVNFRLAPMEMRHIIEDSGARILIFESVFADQVAAIRAALEGVERFVVVGEALDWAESWDAFLEGGAASGPDLPPPGPDDLCYLIYTSGTTGRPKGCMLEHKAEVATASIIAAAMQLGGQDRTLLMMPLFHIGAKAIALAQQWVGGVVYLHRTYDPAAILADIETHRITATHMAPTLVQGLLDCPDIETRDISSLRTLLYSAAPMPPVLLDRALSVFGPIFQQMYGQTEGIGTLLPVSAHSLSEDATARRRLYSIGHAFIGCEIAILDEADHSLAAGEIGEICIRSPVVMRGYWNNSAASLATLRDGWLHTGDVGHMDAAGYAYLVDRKKDVIISGGENIYSREVEDAILAHPDVLGAAVVGVPDAKWGEAVLSAVVTRPGSTLTEADVVDHCRTLIAGYKRPRRVVFVDSLPILPSGKINKPALRDSLRQGETET